MHYLALFNQNIIYNLNQTMIKRILPIALRAFIPKACCLPQSFCFSTIDKFANFRLALQNQIKAESDLSPDLKTYQNEFKQSGWTIKRQNTLVELSKTMEDEQIRLLSNIKAPLSFDHQNQQNSAQAHKQQQMNEITICITKLGISKTMSVHTMVNKEHFQIVSINFTQTYQQAKNNRLDIVNNSNQYIGPIIETLPPTLLQALGIYLKDLGITYTFLRVLGDYCFDHEQLFYIDWLKDLKNTL